MSTSTPNKVVVWGSNKFNNFVNNLYSYQSIYGIINLMDTTPVKILIIDENHNFLDLYETALGAAGFNVFKADNAKDGIELAEKEMPKMILLDVNMPNIDGVEIFSKLKKNPQTKDIKIIFLSAFGDPKAAGLLTDKRIAKELSAIDFIKKGTEISEIVKIVREYVDGIG